MTTQRAWSEQDRQYIEIAVTFSGKDMPGAGPGVAWRGAGSWKSIEDFSVERRCRPGRTAGVVVGGRLSPRQVSDRERQRRARVAGLCSRCRIREPEVGCKTCPLCQRALRERYHEMKAMECV
jgi:hypothetical protein